MSGLRYACSGHYRRLIGSSSVDEAMLKERKCATLFSCTPHDAPRRLRIGRHADATSGNAASHGRPPIDLRLPAAADLGKVLKITMPDELIILGRKTLRR